MIWTRTSFVRGSSSSYRNAPWFSYAHTVIVSYLWPRLKWSGTTRRCLLKIPTHLRCRQTQATVSRANSSRIVAVNAASMATNSFPAFIAAVGAVSSPTELVLRPSVSPATNDDWLGSQSSGGSTTQKQFVLISAGQPVAKPAGGSPGRRRGARQQDGRSDERLV